VYPNQQTARSGLSANQLNVQYGDRKEETAGLQERDFQGNEKLNTAEKVKSFYAYSETERKARHSTFSKTSDGREEHN
jgi:hypothetical protein